MPSGDGPPQDSPEQSTLEAEISPRKCGIILTREDYYTVPALDVLDDLCVEGEHLSVQDFVVGRKNYGKITFCGETCVKDLNLDELGKTLAMDHSLLQLLRTTHCDSC